MDASTHAPLAAPRSRFVVAIGVDVTLMILIFGWPGWESLSFLTDRTPDVLGLVALCLAVDIAANVVAAVSDTAWTRSAGEFAAATCTVLTLAWILAIFPFDFTGLSVDWTTLIQILLVLGIVGAGFGAVAHGLRLRRYLAERNPGGGWGRPDRR